MNRRGLWSVSEPVHDLFVSALPPRSAQGAAATRNRVYHALVRSDRRGRYRLEHFDGA